MVRPFAEFRMLSVRTILAGFFVVVVVGSAAAQDTKEKTQALNVDLGDRKSTRLNSSHRP